MANFGLALAYVLKNEGGWLDNDPPGSCTNCGLTQDAVSSFLGAPVSAQYMRELSTTEVSEIYAHSFWAPIAGDKITHQGVATAIFDMSVNRGPALSARYAQCVLRGLGEDLVVDGMLGPLTLEKLNQCDPRAFIDGFVVLVKKGYYQIVKVRPEKKRFLSGWLNRAQRLLSLKDGGGAPILPSGPQAKT